VLAVLSDKDLRGICEALAPNVGSVILPKIRGERAASPAELAKIFSIVSPSLPSSITSTIDDALMLARANPNPILITGSLHFAGEVLAHLRGSARRFRGMRAIGPASHRMELMGAERHGREGRTAERASQTPYNVRFKL
jgi:hypothetical protein